MEDDKSKILEQNPVDSTVEAEELAFLNSTQPTDLDQADSSLPPNPMGMECPLEKDPMDWEELQLKKAKAIMDSIETISEEQNTSLMAGQEPEEFDPFEPFTVAPAKASQDQRKLLSKSQRLESHP